MKGGLLCFCFVFAIVAAHARASADLYEDVVDEWIELEYVLFAREHIIKQITTEQASPKQLYVLPVEIRHRADERPCRVQVLLYNNLDGATVKRLVLTVTAHDRVGRKISTEDLAFRFVDPHAFDLAEATVPASCYRIDHLRLRAVPVCVIVGQPFRDCLAPLPNLLRFDWYRIFDDD